VDPQHEVHTVLAPTAVISHRPAPEQAVHVDERIALVDLLDRVLAGGVVVAGEITLSIADVDMVTISLRALVTSVSTLARAGIDPEVPGR
jgi:hypothetical protein